MKKLLMLIVAMIAYSLNASVLHLELKKEVKDSPLKQIAVSRVSPLATTEQGKSDNISDIEFQGAVKTSNYGDKKTKFDIQWTKAVKGNKEIDITDINMTSSFLNKGKVRAPEYVKATGNMKELTSKLVNFDKLAKKKKTPEEENAKKEALAANKKDPNGPTSGSGSYKPSPVGASSPLQSDIGKNSTPINLSSSSLECKPEFDTETKLAYEMQKEVVSNNGEQTSEGSCARTGATWPLVEDFEECDPTIDLDNETYTVNKITLLLDDSTVVNRSACLPFADPVPLEEEFEPCGYDFDTVASTATPKFIKNSLFENRLVKKGSCLADPSGTFSVQILKEYDDECPNIIDYNTMNVQLNSREIANINGKIEQVSTCQLDDSIPLEVSYDGCNKRHDFLQGITLEQREFFYMNSGQKVVVSDCMDDLTNTYTHYLTTDTCDFTTLADGNIMLHKRIAYQLNNGFVEYASKCEPDANGLVALSSESCGYEDDLLSNVSYLKTSDYYIDPDTSEKITVTACGRSTTSYPHVTESQGWENDDVNMRAFQKVSRYFNVPDVGRIDIDGGAIETLTTPVPYLNNGESSSILESFGVVELSLLGDIYYYGANEIKFNLDRVAASVKERESVYDPNLINPYTFMQGTSWTCPTYDVISKASLCSETATVACSDGYSKLSYDFYHGYPWDVGTPNGPFPVKCSKSWIEADVFRYQINHVYTRPDGSEFEFSNRIEYGF